MDPSERWLHRLRTRRLRAMARIERAKRSEVARLEALSRNLTREMVDTIARDVEGEPWEKPEKS
jgi:hypothetical protein